jgi:hypothetical protein
MIRRLAFSILTGLALPLPGLAAPLTPEPAPAALEIARLHAPEARRLDRERRLLFFACLLQDRTSPDQLSRVAATMPSALGDARALFRRRTAHLPRTREAPPPMGPPMPPPGPRGERQ